MNTTTTFENSTKTLDYVINGHTIEPVINHSLWNWSITKKTHTSTETIQFPTLKDARRWARLNPIK